MQLAFLKSRYMMDAYLPTMRDTTFEKRFITEPMKYGRILQKAFVTNVFASFRERKRTVSCKVLMVKKALVSHGLQKHYYHLE